MISDEELTQAVTSFWAGRVSGTQAAAHDKAFLSLLARDFSDLGWNPHVARSANDVEALVSGHFRPAKTWDIVCRGAQGLPRICVEFKSQVDSYGNNENNRYEEALGSGLDARARHGREIALGFLLVLCEEDATTRPTRDRLAAGTDEAFMSSSHASRREEFARRIVAFRINDLPFYDAAAVLLVRRDGTYRLPTDPDLDIRSFAARLSGAAAMDHAHSP